MQVGQIAETSNEEQGQEHTGQTRRHERDQEQGSSASARSVRELVSATIARVRVSLQGQGQRIREGHRQGKWKLHEHLRADPQQREGQGEIEGANVWNLLDMRRRAPCGELPQGQGQGPQPSGRTRGLRPVGARGMGEPGDPHPIAHPGADARPKAGGREQGGLDVDRFREEAPPTGRGEEGQEGESSGVEDHPHRRARDGQQRHDQEQVRGHRPRGGSRLLEQMPSPLDIPIPQYQE